MQTQTWILASQSPRRAQLLAEAQIDFEPVNPPFNDPPTPKDTGDTPQDIAIQLSQQKALSVQELYPNRPIIAADTLIIQPDGSLAGTPTLASEAQAMIRQMLNQTHWVVTGVTLLQLPPKNNIFFADTAQITLGNISDSDLQVYLNTGHWQGKAGGYNLFERQKAHWPITVKGDPTTVVGLPMTQLLKHLAPNP
ncbi:septum formation protein Maf [bacterium AH-315-I18]|nr:septum formation protein Maf [bacterium AH-315-I18]